MTDLNPRKRPSSAIAANWDKCLCHKQGVEANLLTNFSDRSWKKFKESAERRRDDIFEVMRGKWEEEPKGGYHRQCYQFYTNKGHLARLERKHQNAASPFTMTTSESPNKRVCRSQLPRVDINKCIICQRDKFKRGTRSREPLTQNISDFGSQSLLRAAQIRNDERILTNIQGQDTIAIEVRYHRTCYKDYVRSKTLTRLETENCQLEDDSNAGYDNAFKTLSEFVHAEILIGAKALEMSQLLERYIDLLS